MNQEHPPTILDYGYESVRLPGQLESGDLHFVMGTSTGGLVGVVDGLGHGAEAATAAQLAIKTIEAYAEESVITIVKKCDEKLRKTRGAVMALASINTFDETVTLLSIGNVEGMLVRIDPSANPAYENIITRPGVVGYRLPPPIASVFSISRGDYLIFCTDGIREDFSSPVSRNVRYAEDVLEKLTDSQIVNLSKGKPVEKPSIAAHEYAIANEIDLSFVAGGKDSYSPKNLASYISKKYIKGTDDALVLVAKYRGRA